MALRCSLDLHQYADVASPMSVSGDAAPFLSSRGAWKGGLVEYALPPCALRLANATRFELHGVVVHDGNRCCCRSMHNAKAEHSDPRPRHAHSSTRVHSDKKLDVSPNISSAGGRSLSLWEARAPLPRPAPGSGAGDIRLYSSICLNSLFRPIHDGGHLHAHRGYTRALALADPDTPSPVSPVP